MATTLEELRVIIEGEIAPFQKKMKQLESQMKQTQEKIEGRTKKLRSGVEKQASSMASALGRLAKITALAYLGKKMLDLGMYSTQMALEVTASVNQIKRQMGESSQAFLKWIDKNANAMNMSVGEATKYGAVYSNLFSNFIKNSEKLSAYTGKMLQTSAVIAQGSGRTMTDVMERIRSGLLGNTEAIEDLGINVNVAMIESTNAFKKFANGQSWQQLDYNTQQQIRLMAILEQATAKYGNTLQQSVNSRISLFKSLLSDAALNIGNALLPVINAIMPVLNSLAMVLKNVTAKLAEFVGLMFNKKATVKNSAMGNLAKGAQNANSAVGDLGDTMSGVDDASGGTAGNLDDTAKSAKKAAKELLGLAGFDEITTLKLEKDGDSSGSGSNGGKGGKGKGGSGSPADILPEIALEDMDNQFKSIFDGWDRTLEPLFKYLSKLSGLFKDGFSLSFRADSLVRFREALEGIWRSLQDIFADGTVLQAAARFGERLAFALGQTTGALANVVMGIAVFIAESLNKALDETKFDVKRWLIRQFEIKGDTISSIGNLAQALGQIFYDTLSSAASTNIGSAILSSFFYIGMGIGDITGKIERDFWAFWERLAVDNQEGVTTAFSGLLSAIEPVFESIKNLLKGTFNNLNSTYDEHLKPFFDSFTEGFNTIFGTLVDSWNNDVQPVLDGLGQTFSDMFDNHLQPFIDNFLYVFGQVVDMLKVVWEDYLIPILDWVAANILPVLLPAFQTLSEGFAHAWNVIFDILGAVFKILGGIIEFLTGVFKGDWEKAWNGIVQVAKGIWDLLSSIFMFVWNTILSFLKGVWNTVLAILKAGWDGIVRIFQGLGKWFEDRWKDVENAFSNAGRWFGQKFDEAWNNITNAFSGVANFFRGIYDSIVGWFSDIGGAVASAVSGAFRYAMNGVFVTIENAVNGFIGMINGVIGLINKIPGVSLGSIGYVNLPRLARGGIVDSPTVAMIGEAGKEVVMPLENTGFLQTMGRVVGGAVVAALGGGLPQSSGWPSGDIVIVLGSKEFGRFAIDEINKAQEQAGELLLNI
ncbi:hypothetical protein RFF58_09070 [Streptococcus ruminantium]|nr:hypothetical protein [Streptococcus ruminantium]